MIPLDIRTELSDKWGLQLINSRPVSGGCINEAYELETQKGNFFLKINAREPSDFFRQEAGGLEALRKADTGLVIPKVLGFRDPAADAAGYLLMEFIEEGVQGDASAFGAGLARLHQHKREQYGFPRDNYIGSLPQSNTDTNHWIDFFREQRVEPLLKKAVEAGQVDSGLLDHWERLSGKLDELLPYGAPSLLHGDLWSGNYLYDTTGRGVLIDPAVYYGHPEMDLAFTRMFGGFPAAFYEGYETVSPLESGFDERVEIHNLYPLLVHVRLFGGHYLNQLKVVLRRY